MRDAIVQRLTDHRTELDRLGVKALSIFGSAPRGDETAAGDLDVLVEFNGPATLDAYMDLKDLLEGIARRPVDLVTRRMLKPLMREQVARELVRIA